MSSATVGSSESGGLSVNKAWLPETLPFYSLPTEYMERSWWQPGWLPQQLFERLRHNRRSHWHLSKFIVKQLGLTEDSLSGWEPAHIRLAVTPANRLDRLVSLAGITLLSTAIAGVLRSRDRNRVTSQIGERDYQFAVKRGRFLLQQARLANAAEEVGTPLPHAVDEETRRLGIASLAAALQSAPESLIRRTQLKFTKASVEAHWQPLLPMPDEFLRLFRLLETQEPAA